jgi:hypothetical protein
MNEKIAMVVRRIFERLDEDIRGRKGIKHEWDAIDEDVMNEEIWPEWERIITEEISHLIPSEGAPKP